MALFDWDESFELGIRQFDEHHRYLVGLLNEVHASYMDRAGNAALGGIIDRLVGYMQHHFAVEEQWMASQNYQGLLTHRREHYEFTVRVSTFQKDFHEGKQQLSGEILSFLKEWLFDHILKTDADYGRFAKESDRTT